MPVYKRKDPRTDGSTRTRWQIRFTTVAPDGTRRRVRRTCPDGHGKRDAERLEAQLRSSLSPSPAVAAGTRLPVAPLALEPPSTRRVTFRDFAERWMRMDRFGEVVDDTSHFDGKHRLSD